MGSAYKKNMKNLQGKQDITGRDVLSVGASVGPDVASASGALDAFSIGTYTLTRAARLEGLVADLGADISSGQIDIDLQVNSVSVGTASITERSADLVLSKEDNQEVDLAAGDTVEVLYQVTSALAGTQLLSVRVHLAMLE